MTLEGHGLHSDRQRYQPHLVLLWCAHALPGWHGWSHQPSVSVLQANDNHTAGPGLHQLTLEFTCSSSGPNTLDAFKSAAAKASDSTVPANVAGGVFGTASKGTSSSSSGSATTSASPSATANAASNMRVAGEISALMLLGLFMI